MGLGGYGGPAPAAGKFALAAVVAAASLAALPAVAPAKLVYGVNSVDSLTGPPSAHHAGRMRLGGARLMRVQFGWGRVKPTADGPYRWDHFDQLMANAARGGVDVLALLVGTPRWLPHHQRGWSPGPTGMARYRDYVGQVAARYGRGGSFWRARPGLPHRPITAYEVWNEPNRFDMAPPGPDRAGAYARLLAQTRAALDARDRRARIVTGGLIDRPDTTATSPARFIAQLYDERGVEGDFDAVGLHPYGESARTPLRIAGRVRNKLDEAGDRRRPIWITEIGWGSAGEAGRPGHPLVASEPGQARLLRRSFDQLADAADELRLGALLWYSWLDLRPFTQPGSWDSHAGLFTLAGRKKPAWDAFAKAAGGRSGGDL